MGKELVKALASTGDEGKAAAGPGAAGDGEAGGNGRVRPAAVGSFVTLTALEFAAEGALAAVEELFSALSVAPELRELAEESGLAGVGGGAGTWEALGGAELLETDKLSGCRSEASVWLGAFKVAGWETGPAGVAAGLTAGSKEAASGEARLRTEAARWGTACPGGRAPASTSAGIGPAVTACVAGSASCEMFEPVATAAVGGVPATPDACPFGGGTAGTAAAELVSAAAEAAEPDFARSG